jgi:hypothetical protein
MRDRRRPSPHRRPCGAGSGTAAGGEARDRPLPGGRTRSTVARVPPRRRAAAGGRDGAGQQGLARAGWADQQQAVATGERDLERPSRLGWPRTSPRSGVVRPSRISGTAAGASGDRRRPRRARREAAHDRPPAPPADVSTASASVSTPMTSTRRRAAPRRPRTATTTRRDPAPTSAGDHRQDPGHRPHLATERQLADQREPARPGAPAPSRAGSRSPSPGRATRRPCAGPPGRG